MLLTISLIANIVLFLAFVAMAISWRLKYWEVEHTYAHFMKLLEEGKIVKTVPFED